MRRAPLVLLPPVALAGCAWFGVAEPAGGEAGPRVVPSECAGFELTHLAPQPDVLLDPGAPVVFSWDATPPDRWLAFEDLGSGERVVITASAAGDDPLQWTLAELAPSGRYRYQAGWICLRTDAAGSILSEERLVHLDLEFRTTADTIYPLSGAPPGEGCGDNAITPLAPTLGADAPHPADEPIVVAFDRLPAYDVFWVEDQLGRVIPAERPVVDGATLRYAVDLEPDTTYELHAGWICPELGEGSRAGVVLGFTTE